MLLRKESMGKTAVLEVSEMKKLISFLLSMIISLMPMKNTLAYTPERRAEPSEVGIYSKGVEIPLNRILLIRKENQYCALKFIHAWKEMDEERLKVYANDIKKGGIIAESAREASEKKYATYESYYQKDGTQNFTGENILRKEGTAALLPLRGPFRPFVYQPGNGCVECGLFKLLWSYKTGVVFIPLGKGSSMRDYGFELAPTPWIDIKEVNINDPRIKWYRYDEKRERIFIPIDKLWDESKK